MANDLINGVSKKIGEDISDFLTKINEANVIKEGITTRYNSIMYHSLKECFVIKQGYSSDGGQDGSTSVTNYYIKKSDFLEILKQIKNNKECTFSVNGLKEEWGDSYDTSYGRDEEYDISLSQGRIMGDVVMNENKFEKLDIKFDGIEIKSWKTDNHDKHLENGFEKEKLIMEYLKP